MSHIERRSKVSSWRILDGFGGHDIIPQPDALSVGGADIRPFGG